MAANAGNEPDTSPGDWSLLARQGAPGLTFRQGYVAGTTYALDDAVYYLGSSYISLAANNINNLPTEGLPWSLLAQQGAVGPPALLVRKVLLVLLAPSLAHKALPVLLARSPDRPDQLDQQVRSRTSSRPAP